MWSQHKCRVDAMKDFARSQSSHVRCKSGNATDDLLNSAISVAIFFVDGVAAVDEISPDTERRAVPLLPQLCLLCVCKRLLAHYSIGCVPANQAFVLTALDVEILIVILR